MPDKMPYLVSNKIPSKREREKERVLFFANKG